MKVAVMQPYFLPYLGYFQLVHSVDAFVLYDDVNFIKGGWINRNYILGPNGKQRMTVPLLGASPNRRINELSLADGKPKLLRSIRLNYSRAPLFASVFPLLERIMTSPERNLALFLEASLRQVCAYLGLQPLWYVASALEIPPGLRGQDRVLAVCEMLGATHYLNLPGGKALYDPKAFTVRGIDLAFIEPAAVQYLQYGRTFVPNLSIIDVLMFNQPERCFAFLEEYRLG